MEENVDARERELAVPGHLFCVPPRMRKELEILGWDRLQTLKARTKRLGPSLLDRV